MSESSTSSGPRAGYWRSLSELHGQREFQQYLHREFPVAASEFPEGVSRRRWLQLMGASLALAGATGCRYPEEVIAPFVIRPEGRIPGEQYSRATNFELAGRVYNLLVTNFDGRPIKIEPNREHPSGFGTDVYVQGSILGLYDPDRGRGDHFGLLRRSGSSKEIRPQEMDWEAFENLGSGLVKTAESNNRGTGFAVLFEPTTSPTVLRLLSELRRKLPQATLVRYDNVRGDVMRAATKQVLGKSASQRLSLDKAKVIVTFEADILGSDANFLSNAHGFSKHRDPVAGEMNRLYVVEGGFTTTGATADARLAIRPGEMASVIGELTRTVQRLIDGNAHEHGAESQSYDELSANERMLRFIDVVAHDLVQKKSDAVVVVGEHLGPEAIGLGIRLNALLGSLGTLQTFVENSDEALGEVGTLAQLVEQANAGEIDSLVILGGNPVFSAPGDLKLKEAIQRIENTIYLGEYDDETAVVCDWSLPQAHPLESWGDCVNSEGFVGVCQPQILPLLGGRSTIEVLAMMLGEASPSGERLVRRTLDTLGQAALSEREWRQLLHDGYSESLKLEPSPLSEVTGGASDAGSASPKAISFAEINQDDIEVLFFPADGIYDGRFANNGWLQELPQSMTKLTWDNAALMSPRTAEKIKIEHGQMVALRRGDQSVELPVFVTPGMAPGVVTVHYGYGRTRAGAVGGMQNADAEIVGTNVSAIRLNDAMLTGLGFEARPRYRQYELSATQDHWAIDELGRDETERRSVTLVREGTIELMEKIPNFAAARAPHVPSVGKDGLGSPFTEPMNEIEEKEPRLPQWGMSIDLTKCVGCNACVIACQSENNVPIVGKEQVGNSREMHWLRVDRYFQGDEENADIVQQPVACMHCETAPCEQVCPVAATVHTSEGINAMAYNRCIGTRYCANNCPFKVRRFNYFNYNGDVGVGYGWNAYPGAIENANRKLQALVLNPDVTVRGRGVMEKCTYCVQRVEHAKIEARKDGGRPVRDGEIVTACQSACPTRAIEFGNIADEHSIVSQKHRDVRSYGMLEQLNVKPRTEYLARVRNTPKRLMTRAQLNDLANLRAPHHGSHDSHGSGHDSHGKGHDAHGGGQARRRHLPVIVRTATS